MNAGGCSVAALATTKPDAQGVAAPGATLRGKEDSPGPVMNAPSMCLWLVARQSCSSAVCGCQNTGHGRSGGGNQLGTRVMRQP